MQEQFALGLVLMTPGAVAALQQAAGDNYLSLAANLVARHQSGDWGAISAEDAAENELSVRQGFRILSAYDLPADGGRLWIITEADRSATTLLLPEEY
jgi:hypothetical protein